MYRVGVSRPVRNAVDLTLLLMCMFLLATGLLVGAREPSTRLKVLKACGVYCCTDAESACVV